MKLKVSCPSCGKQFRNIKPELAGKKARCGCGAVVRLGEKPHPPSLLNVDLLGDEMLGDQLLGKPTDSKKTAAPKNNSRLAEPAIGKPKTGDPSTPAASQNPSRRGLQLKSLPPATVNPRQLQPNQQKLKPKIQSQIPQVPITVKVSSNTSTAARKPLFEDTYGDLDDILDGAGDAAPLVVRPQATEPAPKSIATKGPDSARKNTASRLGFFAALLSATLGFWFGLFVTGSRFEIVDWFLLGDFSSHLQSVYSAQFGDSATPPGYRMAFGAMGWGLLSLTAAMILISAGQFVNAFVNILTGRQPLGWFDGLAAASGVAAVFLMLALVFTQSSFASNENRILDNHEKPVVGEGEHLANVAIVRAEINDRSRSFSIWMLTASVVPISIFGLSMLRLFTKSSNPSK